MRHNNNLSPFVRDKAYVVVCGYHDEAPSTTTVHLKQFHIPRIQDLEHGRYALKVPSTHTRDQRNNGQAERAWYAKVVKELDEAKCPDTRPKELSEYVGT
jgi:hypothetical protein